MAGKSNGAVVKRTALTTIDQYFEGVPEPARGVLSDLRATIRSVVPPETTEGIGYGMPTFYYRGALVGIAAFSKHCSLFPYSAALIARLQAELRDFPTAKGTIRFTPERPLPVELVKRIVKARIAENRHRENEAREKERPASLLK